MRARVHRKTKEVSVEVYVNFEGGECSVSTGIPFLDHMLETFAKHSAIGLKIVAKGDLEVDEHHTIEDVAITLGRAIKEALGSKEGLKRFGYAIVPMDESVAICGVDLSGRGIFNFFGEFGDAGIKGENAYHFFDTLCRNSGINAFLEVRGMNAHHKIEASFKAFALSLRMAVEKGEGVRSTKGLLD